MQAKEQNESIIYSAGSVYAVSKHVRVTCWTEYVYTSWTLGAQCILVFYINSYLYLDSCFLNF